MRPTPAVGLTCSGSVGPARMLQPLLLKIAGSPGRLAGGVECSVMPMKSAGAVARFDAWLMAWVTLRMRMTRWSVGELLGGPAGGSGRALEAGRALVDLAGSARSGGWAVGGWWGPEATCACAQGMEIVEGTTVSPLAVADCTRFPGGTGLGDSQ